MFGTVFADFLEVFKWDNRRNLLIQECCRGLAFLPEELQRYRKSNLYMQVQ